MAYESAFARVYDKFTVNTGVRQRAEYIASLLQKYGVSGGILLDLACGTGALSEVFIRQGYDLICVDSSEDMLMEAKSRLSPYGNKALLLAQDMRDLDLYGTINACICSLDSVNHLTDPADVARVFEKVSLFTEPGGVFIFDVNTVYKHRHLLADRTFVYEDETDFLVWQNDYDEATDTVQMLIDIFSETEDGSYLRSSDEVTERAYFAEDLQRMLEEAGFSRIYIFGDLLETPPCEEEERIYFAAIK